MTSKLYPPSAAMEQYAARWFWPLSTLAEACGMSADETLEYIAAGCAPGPIYLYTPDNHWWSALAAEGLKTPPDGIPWFSPGAAWGLRKAHLWHRNEGLDKNGAAEHLRGHFVQEFAKILAAEVGAMSAFPDCYDAHENVIAAQAQKAAHSEWASWLGGGYGVCLRCFTAQNCITKESLVARMKAALYDGAPLSSTALLDMAEQLSTIILPFSPHERASGSPGKTIDRLLQDLQLGTDKII